jgi:hypothetical protein
MSWNVIRGDGVVMAWKDRVPRHVSGDRETVAFRSSSKMFNYQVLLRDGPDGKAGEVLASPYGFPMRFQSKSALRDYVDDQEYAIRGRR